MQLSYTMALDGWAVYSEVDKNYFNFIRFIGLVGLIKLVDLILLVFFIGLYFIGLYRLSLKTLIKASKYDFLQFTLIESVTNKVRNYFTNKECNEH